MVCLNTVATSTNVSQIGLNLSCCLCRNFLCPKSKLYNYSLFESLYIVIIDVCFKHLYIHNNIDALENLLKLLLHI